MLICTEEGAGKYHKTSFFTQYQRIKHSLTLYYLHMLQWPYMHIVVPKLLTDSKTLVNCIFCSVRYKNPKIDYK